VLFCSNCSLLFDLLQFVAQLLCAAAIAVYLHCLLEDHSFVMELLFFVIQHVKLLLIVTIGTTRMC